MTTFVQAVDGNVAWVPVMVVAAPNLTSGQMTPLAPGQTSPPSQHNVFAPTQMFLSGQVMGSGQVTPNSFNSCQFGVAQSPQKCSMNNKMSSPPGQWSSNISTMAPSSACSDAGSEFGDEEEDTAEAVAELMEQIEMGGAARDAALEALEGSVQELAFDPAACRLIQKALECAEEDVSANLANELKGHVCEAIKSPHANHVIQKIVDVLPAHHTRFIVEELIGHAIEMAKHRYGSRVLSRIVKVHSGNSSSNQSAELVEEVLQEAAELSRHAFAHYVVEAILEFGNSEQTHEVSISLRMELLRNAKNRSATYVVEKALMFCDAHDQEAMVSELCGSTAAIVALVENQFGCHVAKALVRIPGQHFRCALPFFAEATPMLQKSKYGRRVLTELAGASDMGDFTK